MRSVKERHMGQLEAYVRGLYRRPRLRQLFLELTLQCNERCFHCGSSCTPQRPEDLLTLGEYKAVLDQVKEDFDLNKLQLCITGGEPLLRPDFLKFWVNADQIVIGILRIISALISSLFLAIHKVLQEKVTKSEHIFSGRRHRRFDQRLLKP